jgi:hypothetical protein
MTNNDLRYELCDMHYYESHLNLLNSIRQASRPSYVFLCKALKEPLHQQTELTYQLIKQKFMSDD